MIAADAARGLEDIPRVPVGPGAASGPRNMSAGLAHSPLQGQNQILSRATVALTCRQHLHDGQRDMTRVKDPCRLD
jgi:hypothetical protein